MNVRRLAADVDGPLPEGFPKCLAVKGSIRGYLYPYPTIEPTQGSLPLLLVEGEFDALIGQQEAGHFTHVGSVGSASVLNLPRETVVAIASCPWLLLALDMDRAGAEASWAWLRKYPHKARPHDPARREGPQRLRRGRRQRGRLAQVLLNYT